jgi:hypothetical protein
LGASYFDKGAPIILSLKEEGIGLSVKDDRGEAQDEGETETAVSAPDTLPKRSKPSMVWRG